MVKGQIARDLTKLVGILLACGLIFGNTQRARSATEIVVSYDTPNGWVFIDDKLAGIGGGFFTQGVDTPPLGTGSANLYVSTSTAGWMVAANIEQGTRFDQITNLRYSTYRSSFDAGNNLAIAFQFVVDYDLTDANNAYQSRLVYEPYHSGSGTVLQNTWQTWNPLSGRWWGPASYPGATLCPQSAPCTWAQVLTNWPNAGIHADPNLGGVLFKAGSGWASFNGYIDAFTIGVNGVETTYNFEAPAVVYVDDDWEGTALVSDPDGPGPATSFGGDAFSSIQDAVDHVREHGTVYVAAGFYPESIVIQKEGLSILGPNAGIDPNTGTRSPEAVVVPTLDNPVVDRDGYTETDFIFYLSSGGVTLNGLTLDGDNPSISSGLDMNGADVDVAYGIYANNVDPGDPLTFSYNRVVDIGCWSFLGWPGGTDVSSGNLVSHNLFDNNLQNSTYPGSGRSVIPLWNYYANVTDNVITRATVGIYAENAHKASAVTPIIWSGNTITTTRSGIWYNLVYGTASPHTIEDNTVAPQDLTTGTRWDGYWLISLMGSIDPTIQNNDVNGAEVTQTTVGYQLWNDTTSAPGGIKIDGGTVSGVDYGVWVNNYDGYPTSGSDAGPSTVTLRGLAIHNTTNAGVFVKDNPLEANGDPVTVSILEDTEIRDSLVGVWVSGPQASALVKGNELTNTTTAFKVDEGALTAYVNNISGETDGLAATSALVQAARNWWGEALSPRPGGISDEDWSQRLVAPILDWSEGSGSATLGSAALSGGTGNAVVVSYGRVEAPFEAAQYGICSDYYDFFTIGGSGLWQAVIPVDDTPDCNAKVRDLKSLFWIPPDEAHYAGSCDADKTDCWVKIGLDRIAIGVQSLQLNDLSAAELGGTAIVASPELVTDIQVADFSLEQDLFALRLGWRTTAEVGLDGFNLYRADSLGGARQKLNDDLILPADAIEAQYDFLDDTVVPGQTYFYWLEQLDIYGRTQLYSPIQATAFYWRLMPLVFSN